METTTHSQDISYFLKVSILELLLVIQVSNRSIVNPWRERSQDGHW